MVRGKGGKKGKDWESRISRYKLLYAEQTEQGSAIKHRELYSIFYYKAKWNIILKKECLYVYS